MIHTDPSSGAQSDYTIDVSNLSPTPPTADSNGVITDVADAISIKLPAQAIITGEELYEAVGFTNGGDTRYAVVSEIGFISASNETVSAQDSSGNPFSYTEAIAAKLVEHITEIGNMVSTVDGTITKDIEFTMRQLIDNNG